MATGLTRRKALTGAATAGLGVTVLAACGSGSDTSSGGRADSTVPAGQAFASTGDVPVGSGAIFTDAGVVVTQPEAGSYKCFSNICTHQGCPLTSVTDTINCDCHGSKFSITDGSVVDPPASAALAKVALEVKGDQLVLG